MGEIRAKNKSMTRCLRARPYPNARRHPNGMPILIPIPRLPPPPPSPDRTLLRFLTALRTNNFNVLRNESVINVDSSSSSSSSDSEDEVLEVVDLNERIFVEPAEILNPAHNGGHVNEENADNRSVNDEQNISESRAASLEDETYDVISIEDDTGDADDEANEN